MWPDGQRAAGGSCVHSSVQESVGKGRGAVGKACFPDPELNSSSFTHNCSLGKLCKSLSLWFSLLSGEGTHLLIQGQSILRRHLWCVSGSPGVQCLEQKQVLEQQWLLPLTEETQDILGHLWQHPQIGDSMLCTYGELTNGRE